MKVLVTGGGGFLGKRLVKLLLKRGDQVRSLQRSDAPELREWGVEVVRGDIAQAKDVLGAVKGVEAVYHVAAKAGVWGPYQEYHKTNVEGTKNVINACWRHDVPRLIYTSSPSVVFDGKDQAAIDESVPYPANSRFLANYPKTKAMAEKLVLEANGSDLATVALRPHLIWGPGDPHLVPRVITKARQGKLRLVGKGDNLVDSTYVDNAAIAHILACDRLEPPESFKARDAGPAPEAKAGALQGKRAGQQSQLEAKTAGTGGSVSACAGKAYFISNTEPMHMAELLVRILDAAGLPPVRKRVSPGVAYAVGMMLEMKHAIMRSSKEPAMTRFVARQLATAHWFDLTAAQRDLKYRPVVSVEEGMEKLAKWLKKHPIE